MESLNESSISRFHKGGGYGTQSSFRVKGKKERRRWCGCLGGLSNIISISRIVVVIESAWKDSITVSNWTRS